MVKPMKFSHTFNIKSLYEELESLNGVMTPQEATELFNAASSYRFNSDNAALQRELLKAAIDSGANLNNPRVSISDIRVLEANKDILCTKHTAAIFFNYVMGIDISMQVWDKNSSRFEAPEERAALQRKFIMELVEQGASLAWIDTVYYDKDSDEYANNPYKPQIWLETLINCKNYLLTPESADKFASITISSSMSAASSFVQIASLVKSSLDMGANINSVLDSMQESYNIPEEVKIEIINYAIAHELLPRDYWTPLLNEAFMEGHFQYSKKLYKYSGINALHVQTTELFVDAIVGGLEKSRDTYKYNAVINLMHKAGFKFDPQYKYLMYNTSYANHQEQIKILHGSAHLLASYYINLVKHNLKQELKSQGYATLEVMNLLDEAFDSQNAESFACFQQLKQLCPANQKLQKIADHFDALYQVVGEALVVMSNDFALEILTIHGGIAPEPLKQDTLVFRGFRYKTEVEDMDSYFKYGYGAHKMGYHPEFLGCYMQSYGARTERAGTYVSLDARLASNYARGDNNEGSSNMLEVRLPKNSPKTCGGNKGAYELILNLIPGENIIAFYRVSKKYIASELGKSDENTIVDEVFANPYSLNKPKYKVGDKIDSDPKSIKAYNELECSLSEHYGLSDADLELAYPREQYLVDQELLYANYFAYRPVVDDVLIGAANGDTC